MANRSNDDYTRALARLDNSDSLIFQAATCGWNLSDAGHKEALMLLQKENILLRALLVERQWIERSGYKLHTDQSDAALREFAGGDHAIER